MNLITRQRLITPFVPGRLVGGALHGGGKRWPPHIVIIDGSQLDGSRTDIPAYGALDLTLVGAADNSIASGVVLVKNGVTKVAYDTVHGVEPGIIRGAQVSGATAGMKVVCRAGSSVGISTIISTTWPAAVTDIATEAGNAGGFDPVLIYYAAGGPDALTAATVAAWEMKFRQWVGTVRVTCPHAVIVVSGLMSTDLSSFPFAVELRAAVRRVCNDLADNRLAYWDPTDFQGMLQPDVTHLTSAGLVLAGMSLWRTGYRGGAIRLAA